MICYRDRTFCSAPCFNKSCSRLLTEQVKEGARKWWGSDSAPIALSNFSEDCEAFQPSEVKNE